MSDMELDSWVFTPDKDISFEHCGRPAYWEGERVFCSKCNEEYVEPDQLEEGE